MLHCGVLLGWSLGTAPSVLPPAESVDRLRMHSHAPGIPTAGWLGAAVALPGGPGGPNQDSEAESDRPVAQGLVAEGDEARDASQPWLGQRTLSRACWSPTRPSRQLRARLWQRDGAGANCLRAAQPGEVKVTGRGLPLS